MRWKHLVVGVAAPVGAGHLHQLEDLELARGRHVRATAQVDEIAFAVQADFLIFRNRGDDLRLVLLAHGLEQLDGVVAPPDFARDLFVLFGQFGHPFLDGDEVFRRKGTLVGEVVVEPVFDDRADRDLGLRVQLLDGIGQQVRRRVADHVEAVRILVRDDGQVNVLLDPEARVDQLPVNAAGQRGLGQARADALRHFGHRHRAGKLAPGTVRQRNRDHACSCGGSVARVRIRGGYHSVVRRTRQVRQSVGPDASKRFQPDRHAQHKTRTKKTRPRPRFHLR